MITPEKKVTLMKKPKDLSQIPALDLVARLCEALAAEEIDYCHWKSTTALDRSANGDNDLDLLVSRADVQRFVEILQRLGFKSVLPAPKDKLPGVLDFYGLDCPSGCLVHVHAHFQLILGNDLSKNYRLPLEQPYLASAIERGMFRIPAPEFELVIFVIRMVLKHSTWDSLLLRHGSLSPSERGELDDLVTPANLERVSAVLEKYIPYVNRELFDACLRTLQPKCSLGARILTGERLQRALRCCARYPQFLDVIRKFVNRVEQSLQARVFRCNTRHSMANGGLLVGIVGGDGAGKSTVIDELYRLLAKKINVVKLHMGKPRWSWMTIAARGLLKIGTLLGLYRFEVISEQAIYTGEAGTNRFPGYPALIRMVCTARDRYLTYLKARRFSSNGGLVLCDRYSLPGFMAMDGPQCARLTGSVKSKRFIDWLVKLENSYYQQIVLPDLLIVLKVDPEIAVQRKVDEHETSVRARSREVWDLEWERLPAHIINADRPQAEIIAEIKMLVWSYL